MPTFRVEELIAEVEAHQLSSRHLASDKNYLYNPGF